MTLTVLDIEAIERAVLKDTDPQLGFRVLLFEPAHYFQLDGHPGEPLTEDEKRRFAPVLANSYALTLVDRDGQPIFAGGIVPTPAAGEGYVWFYSSTAARRLGAAVVLPIVRNSIHTLASRYGFHTLWGDVRPDFTASRRMFEALGFVEVGVAPWTGPGGQTYIRYRYDVISPAEAAELMKPPVPHDHRRRLTTAQRRQIRQRHAAGESQQSLAREYGVTWATVHRILDPAARRRYREQVRDAARRRYAATIPTPQESER